MRIRLTHIDGRLPNLALMRLSSYHKGRDDEVTFEKSIRRTLFDGDYDRVYGSTIFSFSQSRVRILKEEFPDVILGGTGVDKASKLESVIPDIPVDYDYSIYPDFENSIGFLHRGCRLRCKFCVVPEKEGRPVSEMTVGELWRGEPYPKNLLLLDNDFFGLPSWKDHVEDMREGNFKVCFSQGINIRLISEEAAEVLSQIRYYDDSFKVRRIYTAWDNLKDEEIFFRGIDRLESAGVSPKHVMAYMLIGYDPEETWDRIHYRFNRMVERGILPYPMVYNNVDKQLKRFQRWVIRRYYEYIPFEEYDGR